MGGICIIKKFSLCIFAIFLVACSEPIVSEQEKEEIDQQPLIEVQGPSTSKEPEFYTASISAIGDILAHSPIYKEAYIGNDQYDFSKMFTQVKPFIEHADITIANSESIIGGKEIGLSSYPQFNSPYELGDILKDVGVDVVNMANNHTLDRGEQAIINATKHWNELGVTYIGAATSFKESQQIKTATVNNITFSFLAYTYGTNGLVVPEGKEYLVNYIDEEKMKIDIQKAKEISDIVVLNLHIGDEYSRLQNDYQEYIAQLACDYGVDIIFAHHPHVLQPVEWYTGINGNKTFVIHSLGNFLSSQDEIYRQIGAVLEIEIEKTVTYDSEGNSNTLIEVKNPKLLPTYVNFENRENFEIIPMYQLTDDILPNSTSLYNEIKSHMNQFVPELEFIETESY